MWLPEVITSTPQLEQLVADLAGDAEAGGRVLGVGDDEIDLVMSTSAAARRTSSRPGGRRCRR